MNDLYSHPEMSWLAGLANASGTQSLRGFLQARLGGLNVEHLRSVAIVGSAVEGQRLARICASKRIEVSAIVDDDPKKAGTIVAGQMVEPTGALMRLSNATPIVIASHRVLDVSQRLRDLGFKTVIPFALLQVLAPEMFPPHMFYSELLDDLWAHRSEYIALNDRLADQPSRHVLEAVIGFRLTLDPAILRPVVSDRDLYAPEGLFEFGDDEVYADGGSYDGDTIRSFIERVRGRYADIYAFEPDPVTFQKLKANFQDESRIHLTHAGLYSRSGRLRFRDDASRGAIFVDDGVIEMPVVTIDEVLGDRRLTYLKMNIEGAEIDALRGSRMAIRKWLPKLAISVYHRASDLWRIPELILELSPDYELYLRQHDGGIIETVLYALPRSRSTRNGRT